MPRGPRLDIPGALHHVMVRGLEARKIFLDDRDREDFLQRIAIVVPEAGAGVYAWALMPNHAHVLLRTGKEPISRIFRRLLTGYAVSFNRRHKRVGHVFQNRFKSILVEEDSYLLQIIRYIHLNPVRAHLVLDIDGLDAFAWSGHAALMGNGDRPWQDVEFVLQQFGGSWGAARLAYRQFVEAGVQEGRRADLTGGGLLRSVGGLDNLPRLGRGRESGGRRAALVQARDLVAFVAVRCWGYRPVRPCCLAHARQRRRPQFHPSHARHAQLSTIQIYTQVSIETIREIHTATHPGARLRNDRGAMCRERENEGSDEADAAAEVLSSVAVEASEKE